jgi:hypothetical protein
LITEQGGIGDDNEAVFKSVPSVEIVWGGAELAGFTI